MSDYAEKIAAMVWSFSRLSTFDQCKYSFYLKYIIDNDDEYLAEGNYWAEVGSFMHEILEKIFKGELKQEDSTQYFVDHYDDRVLYRASKSIMSKTYAACISYLETEDFWWIRECEIIGVERNFEITVSGYKFTGYIDLLLRNKHTGALILLDHKSAAYPLTAKGDRVLKANEKSFASYGRQMYLYCHAVKELYGEFPVYIVWNHFKAGRMVKISFNQDEYEEAMKWFLDTIAAIENEQDFPETLDYFYCHNLCDFRNSCEYKHYSDKAE